MKKSLLSILLLVTLSHGWLIEGFHSSLDKIELANLLKDPNKLALCKAVKSNNVAEVRRLLEEGVLTSYCPSSLRDPYLESIVVETDNLEIIRMLIEKGVPADTKLVDFGNASLGAYDRHTPLWRAVFNNNSTKVRLLLELGANPNTVDPYAWNQAVNISPDIIEMLLSKGFNPNKVHLTFGNNNIAFGLLKGRSIESLRKIIPALRDINHRNNEGQTLLYNAIRYKRFDVAHMLLEAGADPNISDQQGKTAVDLVKKALAQQPDNQALQELLVEMNYQPERLLQEWSSLPRVDKQPRPEEYMQDLSNEGGDAEYDQFMQNMENFERDKKMYFQHRLRDAAIELLMHKNPRLLQQLLFDEELLYGHRGELLQALEHRSLGRWVLSKLNTLARDDDEKEVVYDFLKDYRSFKKEDEHKD